MSRSKSDKMSTAESSAFAKHAQQDQALVAPPSSSSSSSHNNNSATNGLTWPGRIMVFVVFPLTAGTVGLYMGYLETVRDANKKISFDQDFIMPFLLALAMAVVLFIQTGGFSSNEVKPVVAWPKAKRVRKVIRKKKQGGGTTTTTGGENSNGEKEQPAAGQRSSADKKND